MGRPTAQALDARAERRALIALVAMFALLLQALWPAAAMAAPTLGAGAQICDGLGLKAAPADAPVDQPAHEAGCQHCICPMATSLPPLVGSASAPVRFAAEAPAQTLRFAPVPPARAPPRPPGQGPPTSNA